MHFCLLSQPALYLVSSLLGQVGALPFFQAMMAHCHLPRRLFCLLPSTVSTHVKLEPCTQLFDDSALLCALSTSPDLSVSLDTMSFRLSAS